MAGINLSQSEEKIGKEEKKERFYDRGLIFAVVFFLLVCAGWAGLRFYNSYLDKQIGVLDANISSHSQELEGSAVDRIADFDMRLSLIAEKKVGEVDPNKIYSQLEGLMVPENSLLSYEYDKQDGVITFQAKTDNFKHIAEQMMSLKSAGTFTDVKVDQIARDKSGKITFSIKAHF